MNEFFNYAWGGLICAAGLYLCWEMFRFNPLKEVPDDNA